MAERTRPPPGLDALILSIMCDGGVAESVAQRLDAQRAQDGAAGDSQDSSFGDVVPVDPHPGDRAIPAAARVRPVFQRSTRRDLGAIFQLPPGFRTSS